MLALQLNYFFFSAIRLLWLRAVVQKNDLHASLLRYAIISYFFISTFGVSCGIAMLVERRVAHTATGLMVWKANQNTRPLLGRLFRMRFVCGTVSLFHPVSSTLSKFSHVSFSHDFLAFMCAIFGYFTLGIFLECTYIAILQLLITQWILVAIHPFNPIFPLIMVPICCLGNCFVMI